MREVVEFLVGHAFGTVRVRNMLAARCFMRDIIDFYGRCTMTYRKSSDNAKAGAELSGKSETFS